MSQELFDLAELPKVPKETFLPPGENYTKSFDCSSFLNFSEQERQEFEDKVFGFYQEYGFVVISNIFNASECEASRSAMWDVLEKENPSLDRSNPHSWINLKAKGSYGLSIRGPSFHPTFIKNRQNQTLARILSILTEANNEKDVIISQDRFTVYRATQYDDPTIPGESFSTGNKNLHIDLNPWWWQENSSDLLNGLDILVYDDPQDFIKENNLIVSSLGRHVQCVVNFADNLDEDGGTLVVPYFHRYMNAWNQKHNKLRKNIPWVSLPKDVEAHYLEYAHRISMKEGSILIWDQRVLHGTSPNRSKKCRMAQYAKAGPRHCIYPQTPITNAPNPRLLRRSTSLKKQLELNEADHLVTPELGKFLFGLDILEDH